MQERGVTNVRQADVFSFAEGRFDTILILGHGIGIAENIAGLNLLLNRLHELTESKGQILLTSLDVRVTRDPLHQAYQKRNLNAGKYIGEVRMQFCYKGARGPMFGWLHVDPETLRSQASKTGWASQLVQQQDDGNYLACLTPS